MTKFLLIRHATTDAVGKKLSGRMPGIHLNEEGSMQADLLAQRLQALPITAVYSSPLERAVQTAWPIARSFHLQPIESTDFLEMDFGEWTGKNIGELEVDDTFRLFNTFRSTTRIPGGEMMQEAQLRIIRGLANLSVKHANETVAVISHADLLKAAIAFYAGIHLDLFHRLEISPASLSIVELYKETARILLVNDLGRINF